MEKIEKGYNLKIISLLLVVVTFLLNSTVYGIDLSSAKTYLRVPVGDHEREREVESYYKIFSPPIPQHWTIEPKKIVYHEKADPTRTQLETRYAVAAVILNEKGEAVFAKRNPKLGDIWSLPPSFIDKEDDPEMLQKIQKNTKESMGVDILEIELIGKRMGYRTNPDGSKWQLLMHVVFVKTYKGVPHLTEQMHETGMPKYTDLVLANPEDFLSGKVGGFDLVGAGDCTKCFGAIVFGSYENFKKMFAEGPKGLNVKRDIQASL